MTAWIRERGFWSSLLMPFIILLFVVTGFPAAMAYDWRQFNGNSQHDGNNMEEKLITTRNVGRLAVLFSVSLPAAADGAPIFLESVSTPMGTRDVLYLTTMAGHLVALDARTGVTLWVRNAPALDCRINKGTDPCYTTSSPVIDPNRQFVYSYGLDGYVHKYRVGDGFEIRSAGWPALTTLKPYDEKASSALSIATDGRGISYLYVAHAGYPGDRGDYQGHVTAINLANGSQQVFNANCSDKPFHLKTVSSNPYCGSRRSGIWARAGVIYDRGTDRIFFATGNGPFDPLRHDWGDSVLALRADATGQGSGPLDSYTPENFKGLEKADADLGSTAPAILPTNRRVQDDHPVPKNRPFPEGRLRHLAIQSGKDGHLRLLDLGDLSGRRGPGHTGGEVGEIIEVPQGGEILTAPVVWMNPKDSSTWVFLANDRGISALRLEMGPDRAPALQLRWRQGRGGTSPLVANGILFCASRHLIRAFLPETGDELWSSTSIGAIHWQTPVVANGILYLADSGARVTAFSLSPE